MRKMTAYVNDLRMVCLQIAAELVQQPEQALSILSETDDPTDICTEAVTGIHATLVHLVAASGTSSGRVR